MKIDWKRKLASRKFWAAVTGFVVPILIAFKMSETESTQIASIIMAGGSLIAYIVGEGICDANNKTKKGGNKGDDKQKFSLP